MTVKIISSILMLATIYIGISHGLRVFKTPNEQYLQMMTQLGITNNIRIMFGVVSILSVILIVVPKTFFIGNVIRAIALLVLMLLALQAGNYKFALIEIPFIAMPALLIYLGHPLQNS